MIQFSDKSSATMISAAGIGTIAGATLVIVLVGLVAGGQMGLFKGTRPEGLGVKNGLLKSAPLTPNCVNSQAIDGESKIAPFSYTTDGSKALSRIKSIVEGNASAKIIESRQDYLYAEFTSTWLGFVDDVEFYLDQSGGVIHVRSASRLGKKDMGVNRKRVEQIRTAFTQVPA